MQENQTDRWMWALGNNLMLAFYTFLSDQARLDLGCPPYLLTGSSDLSSGYFPRIGFGCALITGWEGDCYQSLVGTVGKPGGRHPGEQDFSKFRSSILNCLIFSLTLSYCCIYPMIHSLWSFSFHISSSACNVLVYQYMACQKCFCSLQSMSERPMLLQFFIVIAFFTSADLYLVEILPMIIGLDCPAQCADWDFLLTLCTEMQLLCKCIRSTS